MHFNPVFVYFIEKTNFFLVYIEKHYIFSPIKTNNNNLNKTIMKTFKLTIFKGHEMKQEKIVMVNTREELKYEKNGFWSESSYKNSGKNWMGVKRIK